MILRLWRWLYSKGWPGFDCIDCIGAGCGYYISCYCAAHDCVAPCEFPSELQEFARWLHGFLFINTSPYWRDLR